MKTTNSYTLGIDIGGTFTDLVALNLSTGYCETEKVLTTPDSPQLGVKNGLNKLLPRIGGGNNISRVVHATTLFSNSVIERKGSKTGLVTSLGFKDTLELRRERKYDIYDLFLTFPQPLVQQDLRHEVSERIANTGKIITKLDEESLIETISTIEKQGIRSLAISFINAHINPIHEQLAGQLIASHFPELAITLSSDISREPGEFERTSSAVINAFIKPLASEYIDQLHNVLQNLNIQASLMLMLSNGGLTHLQEAKRVPIQLLESGPAAGALSAALIGGKAGENRLLAFDMGGTTAKLAIVDDGNPEVTFSFEAARERRFAPGSGLPVCITTVELVEIGAGGGSIAKKDSLGLLKAGPESAGSVPGPVCYDRGGADPTVTDADLLLGYLDASGFSEGSLNINSSKSASALETLGKQFEISSSEIALGIHEVVCENMAMAAQVHLAKKGRDPRDYTLYATGGAAPVHACAIADRLGIRRVIIPPAAGVGSALGLTLAPARVDRSIGIGQILSDIKALELENLFSKLEDEANAVILESVKTSNISKRRLAELRYSGQGAVLVVDITKAFSSNVPLQAINDAFNEAHQKAYGRYFDASAVEFITARVEAQAATIIDELQPKLGASVKVKYPNKARRILLPGSMSYKKVNVFHRNALKYGQKITGPAIIEEGQSTTVLPHHTNIEVDPVGNLIIEIMDAENQNKFSSTQMDNPIHLEILWNKVIAAADEAAASLLRSSFSTVVRESYDFSCVITDSNGNSLAQASDSIPSFIGTLPDTVKHFINHFSSENLFPGDVLITNDPYFGTGHLPDISVCKPLFNEGHLIGFSASTAHAPDIGGKIRSPEPREVYEEGLQIPILKLIDNGTVNETFMAILRKNVRVADQVEGDLEAQISALGIMEKRISDIINDYQLNDLSELSKAVCRRTELATRKEITNLPDGIYKASVATDGLSEQPIEIAVEVTIKEDTITVDFSGSSRQVSKAINCPLCYTRAMTSYAIKSALAPELPNNDGALRPITVVAPEGSIVNPQHPASVGSRVLTGHYIPALIMDALSKVAPQRVLAGAGSPIWCVNISGTNEKGIPITGLFFFNGGMGASAQTQGLSCVSWPSNISSTSAEEIENRLPVRILKRALRKNSGGLGKHNGGDGQLVEFEYTGVTDGVLAFLADRIKTPAKGLSGGGEGAMGILTINGQVIDPKIQHIISPGSLITLATPGGGGYGTDI